MLLLTNLFRIHYMYTSIKFYLWSFLKIFYKKTDEWYIEWQRVTTNDNEWQRVVQRVTTNDNEWQRMTTSDNEWQQVVQRVTKSENEWQRVTTNGNEWQQVRAVVQRMKTAQYTSKNGWLSSFQWQKRDTLLLQGMDGCN